MKPMISLRTSLIAVATLAILAGCSAKPDPNSFGAKLG